MTSAPTPGPQPLAGYLIRDYDHLIATLARSRQSQGITYAEMASRIGSCYLQQVFSWLSGVECRGRRVPQLAAALGYDLALIPRDSDTPSGPRISPQAAEDALLVPRSSPDGPDVPQELSGGWGDYPLSETYPGSGIYE